MVNNPIQEKRMKTYFIDATKEILKSEGIKALSVRNIAQQAGYSYATLYNYFKDIKELIFECVQDFQDECETLINEEADTLSSGSDKIKGIVRSYIKYFVQYPGIFDLFFLEKTSDIGQEKTTELITSFLNRLCANEWKRIQAENAYTQDKIKILSSQLNYIVTGMLVFYINRRQPGHYNEFISIVNKQMDHLFQDS